MILKFNIPNIRNILSYLLLYLALCAIPWHLIDENSKDILSMCSKLLLLLYIYFDSKIKLIKTSDWKVSFIIVLVFIPLCFSNYFVLLFSNFEVYPYKGDPLVDIISIIISILIEELIFRVLLIKEIKSTTSNTFLPILCSSLLFSFVHFFNYIYTFNYIYLLQVVYTFFLGLILSSSYIISKDYKVPVAIHLLFNLFNGYLFNKFIMINIDYIYIIIKVIVGIYAIIMCGLLLSKEKKYVTKDMDI